jgi:hypothetical protein
VLGAIGIGPGDAAAQEIDAADFAPVTDRDFAIDLYQGAAIGSLRTVGMGGAAIAIAEGSAGALANPAGAAVRADSSRGRWDWDWHFDALSSGAGADSDNNGLPEEARASLLDSPALTIGLVGNTPWWRRLSFAVAAARTQRLIERGDGTEVVPSTNVARFAAAVELADGALALGLGVRVANVGLERRDRGGARTTLFTLNGAALEAGALWRPPGRDLRIGVAASLPASGEDVVTDCDPLDCEGYVIPERLAVPWQLGGGIALRRGPTPWNRAVAGPWRDETYWLFALDVVVTGRSADGHGLEAYALGRLQPAGRTLAASIRGGVEREWIPGWFRARAGSYWEPARFRDPDGGDVPGRLHLTLGLDVRVARFCFWGERYRLRVSLTGDAARRYGNGGLSIGLWH